MSHTAMHGCAVEELSVEDGRKLLDAQVQDALGIDRGEFLRRVDAGEYDGSDDETILRLRMLAPYGR